MTGAQLLGLLMKAEIGGRDSGLDRLSTVADNHMDGGRAEALAVSSTCSSRGLPASRCRTLGLWERIRDP